MNGLPIRRPHLHGILLLAMMLLLAPQSAAGRNLLQNGDFAKGSGDQPDNWRTEAWINKPEAFMAHWHPGANGQPSEVEVDNLQPDDGRWEQAISLAPEGNAVRASARRKRCRCSIISSACTPANQSHGCCTTMASTEMPRALVKARVSLNVPAVVAVEHAAVFETAMFTPLTPPPLEPQQYFPPELYTLHGSLLI
jgi:hypothetical protein